MRVHHIGIATDAADAFVSQYRTCFGATVAHDERDEEKGMRFRFLDFGNTYLEVIEPLSADSIIGEYLAENDPGIHHVAFGTKDIEGALKTARENGIDLIDEEPRPGAWGHRIAFLHPGTTGGALVEFVEEATDPR